MTGAGQLARGTDTLFSKRSGGATGRRGCVSQRTVEKKISGSKKIIQERG